MPECEENCSCKYAIEQVEPDGDCVADLKFYKPSWTNCWGFKQLVINLFCVLRRIAVAVEALVTTPTPRQDGLLHFRLTDWTTIANGACLDIPLMTGPFEHEITGIGVSYQPGDMAAAHGAYSFQTDDILEVKLWDYTADVQLGTTLNLTTVAKQVSLSNEGEVIAAWHLGHLIGVKLCVSMDAGDSINDFPIDVIVYIKPNELNPS